MIERRPASNGDRRRLQNLDGQGLEVIVDVTPSRIIVTDRAGWREEVQGTRYRLTDPRGNVVTRRAVTERDLARLRTLLGADRPRNAILAQVFTRKDSRFNPVA
ncbi:hypothetical protein ACFSHQ_10260 [Gemmobacter lanyuensis]